MLKPSGRRLLICVVFSFAFVSLSYATGSHSLGVFNSPGGFGLSYALVKSENKDCESFSLVADMYGIYSGLNRVPGIRFSYVNEKVYKARPNVNMYYGIGCAAGYVRDLEANALPWQRAPLYNNYGFMCGLSVAWGARFFFERNINLDLGLQATGGVHMRANENGAGLIISLYKNGLLQALCPVLKIQYRF